MIGYHQRQFLLFSTKKQHKKCAEILRQLYEEPDSPLLEQYKNLQEWMNLSLIQSNDRKQISDRFHFHLQNAEMSCKEHNLLPQIRKEDTENTENPLYPIAIYLDHIRSAHNVGSIIRTTEAMRLGEIHFSSDTPFTDHKQVQDTAMGTSEWIPCHQNANLGDLPHPIIALETSPDAIPMNEFLFPEQFTLVVGNEEYGCSDQVLTKANYLVEIPLRGQKNSLNVANAFAMAAGEIFRQRNLRGES